METVDCVVVGAGVVGLAVARALALSGREVLVIESAPGIGSGVSSRSSEVIHAGMYYPQGSLKARLCVRGNALLYAYCAQRGVGHQRCGKLIVATAQQQLAQLNTILYKGHANGVHDLQLLTAPQAQAMEPALACVGALHSPSTGIVDSHGLMLALQGDLEHCGGIVACNSPVASGRVEQGGIVLAMVDGTVLHTRTLVNAAGLGAIPLARKLQGLDARHVPTPYYAKGSYFQLTGRAPFTQLVYPVPEGVGGLGVHLTLDLGGQARFGPDVQWVDDPDDLAVDPARSQGCYAEIRKYWPQLPDNALSPAYAGMRPKIYNAQDPAVDFLIQGPTDHGVAGLVNLFGIESPGLTSSLAIGEYVAALLHPL
jgi:L-2-hydroxyglutarate oxidase LhgO